VARSGEGADGPIRGTRPYPRCRSRDGDPGTRVQGGREPRWAVSGALACRLRVFRIQTEEVRLVTELRTEE